MIGNKNIIKASNAPEHNMVRQAKAVTHPNLNLLYKLTSNQLMGIVFGEKYPT